MITDVFKTRIIHKKGKHSLLTRSQNRVMIDKNSLFSIENVSLKTTLFEIPVENIRETILKT